LPPHWPISQSELKGLPMKLLPLPVPLKNGEKLRPLRNSRDSDALKVELLKNS
jgi:hypothetical protein